ncbi:MAG: hydantoinase/oxoprolinase family protein [Actinomycetota bacterium]
MGYRIGIDVGGTFTDFLVVEPNGSFALWKSPTTPADQSVGVMDGLGQLAEQRDLSLQAFLGKTDLIIHGTTTADNTMIESTGAKTGLLVTKGRRDEIELRRGYKENIWDPSATPPQQLVPRRYRLTLGERLDHQGNTLSPLDEDEVRAQVRRLKTAGVSSVAVVLLFSFVNPAHEQRVGAILAEEFPEVEMVSLSHRVHPAAPEFDRTSTTVVNAYIGPGVKRYLNHLVEKLANNGFEHPLLVMQSSGGIAAASSVSERPIVTLASGPAGGVMGACRVASEAGIEDFISVDMGGTSYDVCLVKGGEPTIKSFWNWVHRYLISLPMVDVISIGAGGGSIAAVKAGGLQVGPESAGGDPGPICYGRGGMRSTVTDANLVLGYLNPDGFAGGTLPLKSDGVAEAIEEQIGEPLGMNALEAAWGIHRLTNANMNQAIVRVSAERGNDPRAFALVVFGGNGAVHALAQASELGIKRVLIPRTAPAFSALGLLVADYLVDKVRATLVTTGTVDPGKLEEIYKGIEDESDASEAAHLEEVYAALESEADEELWQAGVPTKRFQHLRFAQCRYPGQTWDIDVPVEGVITTKELASLAARFHKMHFEEHTYDRRDEDVLISALRVRSRALLGKPELRKVAASTSKPKPSGKRKAYFGGGFINAAIYTGPAIRAGQTVKGPAIIEEPFTTVVIPPGWTVKLDKLGNYVATGR